MTTYLVVIVLSVHQGVFGHFYTQQGKRVIQYPTMVECMAQKHQREFLPPTGSSVAEVYFCVEEF